MNDYESTTMEDLISQLQLVRTNVLPPYTYDDDEGQRSDDEYMDFYSGCLDEAVAAVTEYIDRFHQLAQQPHSDESFAAYLTSRQRFIHTLPFCEDELPSMGEADHDSTYEALRSYFVDDRKSTFRNRDLQSLTQFRDLLCSYQAKLG